VFQTGRRWFSAPVLLVLACAALLPATTSGAATTSASSSTTTSARSSTTTSRTTTTSGTTPGTTGSTKTPPAAAPSITLVRQDPLVRLGSLALQLRVRVKNPPPRAAVQVQLHNPTASSLGFADAIQKGELPPDLDDTPVTIDLSQVPVSSDGTYKLVYPLQLKGQRPLAATLKLITAGVYALDVRLVHCGRCSQLVGALVTCADGGCPIKDSFVTWVVAVNGAAPSGVDVALVWQVASAPLAVDGSLPVESRDAFSERGRLARVTSAIDAAGTMPLTIAAAGETLDAWQTAARHDAGMSRAFEAFVAALHRAHPSFVLAPWVPADVRALHGVGFASSVRENFVLESRAVRAALGIVPERSTAWLDSADAQTLHDLRALGVEQVGMRDIELRPIDAALQHQRVTVAGSPLGVLTDDSMLSGVLRGSDPPALRVQRFVAATALLASDQPGRRAGVVLATSPEWQPDRGLVAALASAAHAGSDPLLHFGTLDDAFSDVTRGNDGRGGPLVRQFSGRGPAAFQVPTARIRSMQGLLTGFASLVGVTDSRLIGARQSMLVAMSSYVPRDDAVARLNTIDSTVAAFAQSIQASARSVTLTSAKTSIPITFTNRTGGTVRLRVELVGDRISQPGGGQDVTLQPNPVNQTFPIQVQVKTSGHFVVSVQMHSITGSVPIGQPARVTVNSRVFGSFAWLTYGALAFLALWWAHHFLRRRRKVTPPAPAPMSGAVG
jgi:hypothetical protein